MVKIGITERGDAALDTSWIQRLNSLSYAVIITKNLPKLVDELINLDHNKILLHVTCTGWGGTPMEPNVPSKKDVLTALQKLIAHGFPARKVVIRVDPIIPTTEGMTRFKDTVTMFAEKGFDRFRISVIDMYPHVLDRFYKRGITPPFTSFQCPPVGMGKITQALNDLHDVYPTITFELCAEHTLANITITPHSASFIVEQGCVNVYDAIQIFNIPSNALAVLALSSNGRQRRECHCLPKTELLNSRKQCPHGCAYCYWKD